MEMAFCRHCGIKLGEQQNEFNICFSCKKILDDRRDLETEAILVEAERCVNEKLSNAFVLLMCVMDYAPTDYRVYDLLSKCYRDGIGVDKDAKKSEQYYNKAAQYGNDEYEVRYIKYLVDTGRRESLDWIKKACEDGKHSAIMTVANGYKDNTILPEVAESYREIIEEEIENCNSYAMTVRALDLLTNYDESYSENVTALLKEAALLGNVEACDLYASRIYDVAVAEDTAAEDRAKLIDSAITWAKAAAVRGNLNTLRRIANDMKSGSGVVERNFDKAVELFVFAKDFGDDSVENDLARMYAEFSDDENLRKKAFNTCMKNLRGGIYIPWMYAYAKDYMINDNSDGNSKQNYVHLLTELSGTIDHASVDLYRIYAGRSTKVTAMKDIGQAMKYLNSAYENGFPLAKYYQADIYRKGNAMVQKDAKKAFDLYSELGEDFGRNVAYEMACMLAQGEGTNRDIPRATEILERILATEADKEEHSADYLAAEAKLKQIQKAIVK